MAQDPYLALRLRLTQLGWPPRTRVGRIAWFILGLDFVLFLAQKLLIVTRLSSGSTLGGWVSFLTFVAFVLFSWLLFRWLRKWLLWRLRNRLIVSYVFIGVIPLILLLTLSATAFYLFAGQFATYIVISGVQSELKTLHAGNAAITHQLATEVPRGTAFQNTALEGLRQADRNWSNRQLTVWSGSNLIVNALPAGSHDEALQVPKFLKLSFDSVVRDHGKLYLRCADEISAKGASYTVISS